MALDLRNRNTDSVVGLVSVTSGRAVLVVAVSPAAVKNGIKAGSLVKIGSTILGGGGGGKDDFAQGGGSESEKIPAALQELKAALGSN